jgi:hypothetical protein
MARSPLSMRVTVRGLRVRRSFPGGKELRAISRETRAKRPGEEQVENQRCANRRREQEGRCGNHQLRGL